MKPAAAALIGLSAKTGDGMASWLAWLRAEIDAQQQGVREGRTVWAKTQLEGPQLQAVISAGE